MRTLIPSVFLHMAVLGGTSPIPGRQKDNFGIGYYYLAISSDLKETLQPFTRLPIIGPKFQLRDEQGVEIFYNIALTGWMKLAADLQIVQPGGPARPPRRSLEFGRRSTFKFDPEGDAMLLVG
jgi:carbohydrate-selective porin OprB